MTSQQDPEELELAAFRFVAGEMPADEAAAFEQQLAGNPSMCEAVSRAVALAEKLALLAPPRGHRRPYTVASPALRPTWLPRVASAAGWIAVGAIAATVVLLVVRALEPPSRDNLAERKVAEQHEAETTDLVQETQELLDPQVLDVLAWTEVRAATTWDLPSLRPDVADPAKDRLSLIAPPTQIPDWMLQTDGEIK